MNALRENILVGSKNLERCIREDENLGGNFINPLPHAILKHLLYLLYLPGGEC